MAVCVAVADPADIDELVAVAARTFPLACPPTSTPENIAAFIDANLSTARFTEYLADRERVILTARTEGRIAGYAMLISGVVDNDDVRRAVTIQPSVELSKIYVLPDSHGAGVSAALMKAALEQANDIAAKSVWLGVNQQNQRAQRFYAKYGFAVTGTRTFPVGAHLENDYVMVREL